MDTLICQGFAYDCSIGFHENEKGVKQKILVDVEVTDPIRRTEAAPTDAPDTTQFDYFLANQLITEFLKDKHFNLIESLGQRIAELLLEKFKIPSVKVSVTKKPLDMPNVGCVKFVCERVGSR